MLPSLSSRHTDLLLALQDSVALADRGISAFRGDDDAIVLCRRGQHLGLWVFDQAAYVWFCLSSWHEVVRADGIARAVEYTLRMAQTGVWSSCSPKANEPASNIVDFCARRRALAATP
jgi:hypothetical protein